ISKGSLARPGSASEGIHEMEVMDDSILTPRTYAIDPSPPTLVAAFVGWGQHHHPRAGWLPSQAAPGLRR
ncbi:MAG TPA: hypothetical protein VGR26_05180, partial [Acidimicrobiales bacterium]|nr:hypothetical protein [Acidimicrobiales bacterium]